MNITSTPSAPSAAGRTHGAARALIAIVASASLALSCVSQPPAQAAPVAPDAVAATDEGSALPVETSQAAPQGREGQGSETGKGKTSLGRGLDLNPSSSLPFAVRLRKDRLPNGITWYVKDNPLPENRIVLKLVVGIGSAVEGDDERGFAHFVEHMAFNGTAAFPKYALVDYLRSIGMEFGAEVNAYTSYDETVYTLEMPADDEEFIEKGLMVLREWANAVAFDPEEVEREKGVILEERRADKDRGDRFSARETPVLLAGSRQADREPIGTEECVRGATAERLKAFYERWYRPGNMAVIVLGTFGSDSMIERVKNAFSFGPPASGEPRPLHEVPVGRQPRFVSSADPEQRASSITLYFLDRLHQETTVGEYFRLVRVNTFMELLRARLDEVARRGEAPWNDVSADYSYFLGATKSFMATIDAPVGSELAAFEALTAELERVRRFGFEAAEIETARKSLMAWIKEAYDRRFSENSYRLAEEYTRNFIYDEPVPGIENEYFYYKAELARITPESMAAMALELLAPRDGMIAVRGPTGSPAESLTSAPFMAALHAKREGLGRFVPEAPIAALMDSRPAEGSLVETIEHPGVVEWHLSNGARVILKPAGFGEETVQLFAWQEGGTSVVDVARLPEIDVGSYLLARGGFEGISATQFEGFMSGKKARMSSFIDDNGQGFSGEAPDVELETLFQLLWLSATSPSKDGFSFRREASRYADMLEQALGDPGYVFDRAIDRALAGGDPRAAEPSPEAILDMDPAAARELFLDRFADAGSMIFVLVGDFTLDGIKPLVLSYIGSLPSTGRGERAATPPALPATGSETIVYAGLEDKASVRLIWTGDAEWSWDDDTDLELLAAVLNNALLDKIREELSGTYGVEVDSSFEKSPSGRYSFQVSFDCDPARVTELSSAVEELVETMRQGSFPPVYLAQIQKAAERSFEWRFSTNKYWLQMLAKAVLYGMDYNVRPREESSVLGSSQDRLVKVAQAYLKPERLFRFVLLPEAMRP